MTFNDIFTSSFLDRFDAVPLTDAIVAMVLACALGLFILLIYRKTYHGVTNIGVKPTVGAEGPLSETWLPEFSGDLYGKNIPVDLLAFIRPEKKFDNLEALQAEILRNGETARQIAQDWERRPENGLFSEENEKNSLAEAEK